MVMAVLHSHFYSFSSDAIDLYAMLATCISIQFFLVYLCVSLLVS